MNMGGATLIYLAALQNIPGELYEAAELDGAGLFSRIRHVTIPQTRLILLMLLMLQIVATMQMFLESFVLTNGGGGAGDNTQSVVTLIYQYAFAIAVPATTRRIGTGSDAMLVLAVFSGGFLWVTRECRPREGRMAVFTAASVRAPGVQRRREVVQRNQDADLQRRS